MKSNLSDVSGVGPSTAEVLQSNGIGTVKKLASASIANLMTIRGFGESRATKIIESAKIALANSAKGQPESAKNENQINKKKKKINAKTEKVLEGKKIQGKKVKSKIKGAKSKKEKTSKDKRSKGKKKK